MTELPESVLRLIAQGNELEDSGHYEAARLRYADAATQAPDNPRPWLNIGNVLQRQGRGNDAIAATQRAVAIAPEFAPSHFNLGNLFLANANHEAAETSLREALRLDPRYADAAINLASVFESTARVPEAEQVLHEVVSHSPKHPGALLNLGLLLLAKESIDDAEVYFRRAVAAQPNFARVCAALGDVCFRTGRAREAEQWYRRSLELDPGLVEAATARLFSLTASDALTAQQIYDAHREFGRRFDKLCGVARHAAPILHGSRRRLRIGYLSPDFRAHAIALFIRPVLDNHDRSAFEIYCYDNGPSDNPITQLLTSLAEHWRNIADLGDDETAKLIRSDELDILVDLAGYTTHSRVLLFSHRCAPIQATWLGYLHSTGLSSADIRICDAHTDPPGMTERLHTERLVRMPHSLWCYRPMHDENAATAVQRSDTRHLTFGAFNQFWKISDFCLDLWLEILDRVPHAVLRVVGVPQGKTMDAFRAKIERRGIAGDRIELLPRLDIRRYFAAIAEVDIALDTMPYNGATTTLDALWMGVPLIALAGDRSVARSGTSILHSVGLPELVADTPRDYVERNLRLACDSQWRLQLRDSLRLRLTASPLMDGARFTRDLESLYAKVCREMAG